MPQNPSDVFVRGWADPNRNKTVEVYYTAVDFRRTYAEATPIDPSQPTLGGGLPLDGVAGGTELVNFLEGPDRIRVFASQSTPFATFTATAQPAPAPGTTAPVCDLSTLVSYVQVGALVLASVRPSTTAGDGFTKMRTYPVGGAVPAFAAFAKPAAGYEFSFAPLSKHYVELEDRNGCPKLTLLTVPRYGCLDPDADNYDALATVATPTCAYAPRLLLDTPPVALVVNGRPLAVQLSSSPIAGAVGAPAEVYVDVQGLKGAVGVVLTLGGHRFESGPILLPTHFADATTLLDALLAVPALAGAYLLALSNPTTVRLTARQEGTPGNLSAATSDGTKAAVVVVPGVDRFRSQAKSRWGCFVEVWTGAPASNPSTFADRYTDSYRDRYGLLVPSPGGMALPVLAQRLELPYQPDNRYRFDIAPALRQFTGHAYPLADGSCPDRLTSFFLRFGEVYQKPGGIRRQHTVYQSGVSWALDAVELVPAFGPDCYLLTSRPAPWRTAGGAGAGPTVLLGNQPGPALYTSQLTPAAFDGSGVAQTGPVVAQGRVTRVALPAAALTGQLRAGVAIQVPGPGLVPVAQLELLAGPVPALTFANGQGGFDTVAFEGAREELTRRTRAGYATATGTATRSARSPEAFRLHSGPLARAEYAWLRRELGNSPAVWLETDAGPVPVTLGNLTPEADEVSGQYALAVECEPETQPALGLVN